MDNGTLSIDNSPCICYNIVRTTERRCKYMLHFASAEILCVGTEILIGDIVNTNAAYISSRLAALGINQYYQTVVGDNPGRLSEQLRLSLSRCDLVIMTGGLGPTYDDLTKETAAAVMGRKLYCHEESLTRLKGYFASFNRPMTENNLKQAMIPEGSVVFNNDNGTAPGCCIEDESANKAIIMLPGPPREMVPMWDDSAEPYLRAHTTEQLYSRNLEITGMGESEVESILSDMMRSSVNPTIAPYCKEGLVRLRITARAKEEKEAYALCDKGIDDIMATRVGEYVYGVDCEIEEALVRLLAEKGLKIAAAESCTGGLISSMITGVAGSSEVYDGSVVSYANRIKHGILGVSGENLESFGAVSEPVAREMAEGICRVIGADVGIAVTGIAGPGGGSPEKPVGTVYIAVSYKGNTEVKLCHFRGNREKVRRLTAVNALAMAFRAVK